MDNVTIPTDTPQSPDKNKPIWRRILKWLLVSAGVIAGLFILVCSLVVWILTPGRLTPLVEREASAYLNADLKASRIELTFWRTFPKLVVDVDSLSITSHSLRSLPDSISATLPADADSLLQLGSFHGGINVLPLLTGRISLSDVEFHSLRVNLIQATDSISNFDIIPASEDEQPDTSAVVIPGISINRFVIADAAPIRFRSLPDSLDFTVAISNAGLGGDAAPRYRLDVSGSVATPILDEFNFQTLGFGASGAIVWNPEKPMEVTLDKFLLQADDIAATINTEIDFSDNVTIKSLNAETADISVGSLLKHLPDDMADIANSLKTDMVIRSTVKLTDQWCTADTLMPSFDATVTIPQSHIDFGQLHWNKFIAEFSTKFNGHDLDASEFNIDKLYIDGKTIDVDLRVAVTNAISDPLIRGRFSGSVDLSQLPKQLKEKMPVEISGIIDGNTDFNFRLSDLSRERFHRVNASGRIDIKNLWACVPDSFEVYARNTVVEFGTNSSFVTGSATVDSLLQVSLKIDTLSTVADGLELQLRQMRAGVGTVNRHLSSDTTEINPFGGKIAVELLKFQSKADTMRARLRDASVAASLRRFKGNSKSPLLTLNIEAKGLMFGQALTKVSLRKADMNMIVHLRERKNTIGLTAEQRTARKKIRQDSIATAPKVETIDLTLDKESRKLLRRWDFSGRVKARSGRLVTPHFPLDNKMRNIDIRFSADSLIVSDLAYTAGQSDFLINGTISNLRRALTSRRNNTLNISLDVLSDTININQIVKALFAGPAMMQHVDSAMVWSDNEQDDDQIMQIADTASTGPLLLPHNINARFKMKANNILYSDLELRGFKGDLLLYDGALNLRNLSASTDIGSIGVNALYSAASVDSLQFGLGMKVNRFRLDKLSSIIPAIDSLMPAMKNFAGVVNADVAVTTDLEPNMDLDIPSLRAAIKIEGDSLVLLDPDTFKTVSKWLFFRNKKKNMIDHMAVEVVVENSTIELYPFMFDIDRYRLGVMGSNDMAMNMNYHISVLKSPMPFKFGINVKGNPDKMKIRLGGAKFKENMIGERQAIADNTRVNLVEQIDNVFRRGISNARLGRLNFLGNGKKSQPDNNASILTPTAIEFLSGAMTDETMTPADSLRLISQGLIANPDTTRFPTNSIGKISSGTSSGKKSQRGK